MIRKILFASVAVATLALSSAAFAFPGYGNDSGGPALIITLNSDGTTSLTATGQPATYDGADDTYIGVVNNSGHTVNALTLTSGTNIFGFEGDGISNVTYGAPGNSSDPSQYGGPHGYFTNINGSQTNGVVNFIGGIADGGSDYFSLEQALNTASFTTRPGAVPEPGTWAMMLGGMAVVGALLRRRQSKAVLA